MFEKTEINENEAGLAHFLKKIVNIIVGSYLLGLSPFHTLYGSYCINVSITYLHPFHLLNVNYFVRRDKNQFSKYFTLTVRNEIGLLGKLINNSPFDR